MSDLVARFEAEMWRLYREPAKRFGYKAHYFREMLEARGAIETARILAGSPGHHEGLTRLYELKALDLSVEALVLRPPWNTLFHPSVLKVARKKLKDLGYEEPAWDSAPGDSVPDGETRRSPTVASMRGEEKPRFLVRCAPERRLVEVWSTYRLQFDNKSETAALKRAIGEAASGLSAPPGHILSAIYVSDSRESVDAENVLLYNVGTARFASAAREGVRFERVFARSPASPETLSGTSTHYHRYEILPRDSEWRHWISGAAAFSWGGLVIPEMGALSKPDAVWMAVRDAARAKAPGPLRGNFALLLRLRAPGAPRPADIVKPLVDGVVSGLHVHDGRGLEVVATRLAARLKEPVERVREALVSPLGAVLGTRRLLWPRGDGYQWNPADDECVACELLWERDPDTQDWILSGSIAPATQR